MPWKKLTFFAVRWWWWWLFLAAIYSKKKIISPLCPIALFYYNVYTCIYVQFSFQQVPIFVYPTVHMNQGTCSFFLLYIEGLVIHLLFHPFYISVCTVVHMLVQSRVIANITIVDYYIHRRFLPSIYLFQSHMGTGWGLVGDPPLTHLHLFTNTPLKSLYCPRVEVIDEKVDN